MNSSDSNSKLPAWIFIATDVALIGAAAFIALNSPQPLPVNAMIAIVACVGLGAIVGLLPLVVLYERQKNEALDDRQRALEALARTVSSSAEQISIAAGGLNEIAEIAQKSARHAEQLPHKLQEKIAEFQAQLAAEVDTEKEELERELLALRTTESERLETVSQRIAKTTAEWVKLEAATQQHLAAANDALAKLGASTAGAVTKAQAEAARAMAESSASATKAIEAAKIAAIADLNAALGAASATVVERFTTALAARITAATHAVASPGPGTEATATPPENTETGEPGTVNPAPVTEEAAAAPLKKPRKPRRENPASSPVTDSPATSEAGAAAGAPAAPAPVSAVPTEHIDEPPPIPAAAIPEITPVAPVTAEPFSGHIVSAPLDAAPFPTKPADAPPKTGEAAESSRPARKRAAGKPAPDLQPALELDDSSSSSAASVAERVLSSDGATRLIVTAYIGIGNRLFVRGEGPGLSWEKGVPLQFVSIGKWRWETNDASATVQFKLYKNDELECSALGTQSLAPGHQLEVTAGF